MHGARPSRCLRRPPPPGAPPPGCPAPPGEWVAKVERATPPSYPALAGVDGKASQNSPIASHSQHHREDRSRRHMPPAPERREPAPSLGFAPA